MSIAISRAIDHVCGGMGLGEPASTGAARRRGAATGGHAVMGGAYTAYCPRFLRYSDSNCVCEEMPSLR